MHQDNTALNLDYFDQDVRSQQFHALSSCEKWKRALIAEDDVFLVPVIEEVLKHIEPDISITWVPSAEEAIRVIQKSQSGGRFDFMYLDIFLDGEKTGVDVWQECRMRVPNATYMVSSSMENSRVSRLLDDSVLSFYLKKPFTYVDCFSFIKALKSYE